MLLLPFVLPVFAIGYLCWFIHRPVLALIGFSKLKQSTRGDARSVANLACQRGQDDEYETLLALGFIPLGIYRETDEVCGSGTDQYVFTHRELPVVCSLCENINQELFIVLTTDDHEGRFVRTSSSAAKLQLDSHDAFAQTIEAETLEQVFVAHVRALDNWEQQGFQPVRVDTLDAIKAHYQRNYQNPAIQSVLRSLYGVVVGASVFTSIGVPIALTIFTPNVTDWFQVNLSGDLLMQIFAATSLAATFSLHRAQKQLSKVPVENSLRSRDQSADAPNSNILEPSTEAVEQSNDDRGIWTLARNLPPSHVCRILKTFLD